MLVRKKMWVKMIEVNPMLPFRNPIENKKEPSLNGSFIIFYWCTT